MATRRKQWGQLTPRQVARLDKNNTVIVLPLGTTGSLDSATRLSADLRVLEGEVKEIVQEVNTAVNSPLAGRTAISLAALWAGVEPGPDQPGTIVLPQATFEGVVEAICSSLRRSGIRFVLLVTRDDDVDAVARALVEQLNQNNPPAWIAVYNPTHKPPPASLAGDVCRALCAILGCNAANCPQ